MVDVLRQFSLHPRLAFAVVGYAAIAPLAFAYAELLPLSHGAAGVLLPAALTALFLGLRHPQWGRRALVGYCAGFVATGIYDLLRLALMLLGLWADPIPNIGRVLLNDPSAR